MLSRQGAAGCRINNIRGIIEDVVPSPSGYEITVNAGDHFYAGITRREMEEQNLLPANQWSFLSGPKRAPAGREGEEKKRGF
ncbi:MAG: hypothetical protein R2756_08805 [Bacteroidales bacterium]